MAFELVVGLAIVDEAGYAEYRRQMTPLLERAGGGFRYDFQVAKVLRSEAPHPIDRLFLIHFPDRSAMDLFFADPGYLAVRARWFEPAVRGVTILAEYER